MRFSADQFDKAKISYQRFPGVIRGITPGGSTFSVNVDDESGFMHLVPQRSAAHRALISALQSGNEGDAVGPYKPSIYGA